MDLAFSGFALIISIIFGYISLKTSRKANDLQNEIVKLTKDANKFEIRKGEILLMSYLADTLRFK